MNVHWKFQPYPEWTSSVDPAPTELRIVQAFINTFDLETGSDEISNIDELFKWLVKWGLLENSEAIDDFELNQAITLREGLRGLLLSRGKVAEAGLRLGALDHVLRGLPLRVSLDPSGGFRLVALSTGWPAAMGKLLTVVVQAMSDGTWPQLKTCPNPDCHWVFYDFSKNQSAKWCSMKRCGNAMKARAYRARKRSVKRSG